MGGNGFSSPMDIFDLFFGQAFGGGGRGGRGRRERRGKDVIHQLSVSLEELYKGAVRKLALQKNIICDKCEGKHKYTVKCNAFYIGETHSSLSDHMDGHSFTTTVSNPDIPVAIHTQFHNIPF